MCFFIKFVFFDNFVGILFCLKISKPQVKEAIEVPQQPSLINSATENKDDHNEIPKLDVENASAS